MTIEQRITGVLDVALRPFQAMPHDPVVTFMNLRTGGVIATRDTTVYRGVREWQEQPFNRQSPVPRRPQ